MKKALLPLVSLLLLTTLISCSRNTNRLPPTQSVQPAAPTDAANIPPVAVDAAIDLTHMPLGDPMIRVRRDGESPEVGALWLCGLPSDGRGAADNTDWLNDDGTWDFTRKPTVAGSVTWNSQFQATVSNGQRVITGNSLPNTPTGIFPIDKTSAVYQYDRNPSSIGENNVQLTFDAIPTPSSTPYCVPYGASGISLTGAAIYHGASTLGTDAAAYEMLDMCGGQSDGTNTYHYHFLTDCLLQKLDPGNSGHSALMGYMMDGFGIYGPRGEDGKVLTSAQLDECHGHTHEVEWDGQRIQIYHYHWTYEFPYNIGCYRAQPIKPWNG